MTKSEIASELYQAYGRATDWKNFKGDPMPTWDELPEPQRTGWIYAASQAAQLYGNDRATPEKIYQVTTEGDVEGRSIRTLGYVTGEPDDIKKYYEPEKYYHISLSELRVKEISPQAAQNKIDLLAKKKKLEQELESVKNLLQ